MSVVWLLQLVLLYVVCNANFATQCGHDEFPCNDGTCIDKTKWCDTSVDCDDDSDELYCFPKTKFRQNPNRCNENFFLCNDGRCIPLVGRCDGYNSCPDNSDEENCGTANATDVISDLIIEATQFTTYISHKSLTDLLDVNDLPQQDSASSVNESTLENNMLKTVPEQSGLQNKSLHPSKLPDLDIELMPTEVLKMVPLTASSLDVPNITDASKITKGIGKNAEMKHASHEAANLSNSRHDVFLQYVNRHDVAKPNLNSSNGSSVPVVDTFGSIASDTNNTIVQGDSRDSQNVTSKGSLTSGFSKLNARDYRKERTNAQQWLLKVRDADYGWGTETARAVVALYMSDSEWIDKHGNEKLLTSNNLHLKLFTALISNGTKTISLEELSLYVNALLASCSDPRNFYGQDLIKTLRYRANAAESSSEFVTPLVYLSLCLSDASMFKDLRKLQDMAYGNSKIGRTDTIALVSLAATCLSRQPKFSSYGVGQNIARTLYERVASDGMPENIYELALVAQALNEAEINHDLWNRSDTMKVITSFQNIDGSFGDILSTYYAVPTLSGKSLVSLGEHCPHSVNNGLIPLEVLNNGKHEKMYAFYSLYFGDPVEVSQSLRMAVPKSSNFFDIMRMAEAVNPIYKFRYDMSNGKLKVYSIGGIVNDAEQGLYWTLHILSRQNSTEPNLVPSEDDLRTLIPQVGDHFVFWRKRTF